MGDLVSIIVPIYNAAEYLPQCLDYLTKQTYNDIEIILINDGSKDDSGVICRKYSLIDSRIKYFEQDNKGAGGARNIGLDHALGKYVIFCDSDDYMPYTGVESLIKHEKEAELIVGGLEKVEHNKLIKHSSIPQIISDKDSIAKSLISHMYLMNTPVNKLYQNRIIQDRHIRFNDFKYGVDTCFVYEYVKHIKSVSFITDIVYHVNVVEGSVSLRKVVKPWQYMRHIYELGIDITPQEDEETQYCLLLRTIKTALLLELRNEKNDFYKCISEINAYLDMRNIIFKREYGLYNRLVYLLLRNDRRELLYFLFRVRKCFL